MGPLILALKVFLYFVFLNARTQRRASNETFDPGFKSPTDACCGLQMAPPENLNAFLSFLELDRSRCRRVEELPIIFQEGNSSRLVIISAQNVLLTPEGLYHAETPAQQYSLVLGWNFPTNCF